MNTMKEVNDQQKEMALKKKIYLLPVPALLLCLYLQPEAAWLIQDPSAPLYRTAWSRSQIWLPLMVPGALPEPQSCILTAAAAIISIADVMALAAAESFQKWTADP